MFLQIEFHFVQKLYNVFSYFAAQFHVVKYLANRKK